MTAQTEIPVDPAAPTSGPCRWCGEPNCHQQITVTKARYRNDRGVRVVARAAVKWWACAAHFKGVQREDYDA